MLSELHLKNYRGFSDHILKFKDINLVVGKNNAGKSTITEAIRLLSIVTARYKNLRFSGPPHDLHVPRQSPGVSPSLRGLDVDLLYVCHKYGEPPAIIEGTFSTRERISIYLSSEGHAFAVIRDRNGRIAKSQSDVRRINLPPLNVLPQIGPILPEEKLLTEEYVRGNIWSALAPLHFRNQLYRLNKHFDDFRELAQDTWPHLRVRDLELQRTESGVVLTLYVQDGPFVAEIGSMGHGLQIWLQTIWFLSRIRPGDTIILDEPDVYLHADLQRRLIRHLLSRPNQLVVATHSVEIMSEVQPESVLIVDRMRDRSSFATSMPAVQSLIDRIGTVHNIQLARLWHARRLLLVEGKDVPLLKKFQNVLYPDSEHPIDTIPNMPIGGWGGWNYAVGSAMLLRNSVGDSILTYCILDSDYHTEAQVQERFDDAKKKKVHLHVWSRKEIENYFLIPNAISSAIIRNAFRPIEEPTPEIIFRKLVSLANEFRDEVHEHISNHIFLEDRSKGVRKSMRIASRFLNDVWKSEEAKLAIVPGKRLISRLSEWSQSEYGVSLNPAKIARNMKREDVPSEISEVLSAIEGVRPFHSGEC